MYVYGQLCAYKQLKCIKKNFKPVESTREKEYTNRSDSRVKLVGDVGLYT